MESHQSDLRAEVGSQERALEIQKDYRQSGLKTEELSMLDYAVKLTLSPSAMREEDIEILRGNGFTDEQIVDAVHCIGYFNFINRVLDGLGVDPEPFMSYADDRNHP